MYFIIEKKKWNLDTLRCGSSIKLSEFSDFQLQKPSEKQKDKHGSARRSGNSLLHFSSVHKTQQTEVEFPRASLLGKFLKCSKNLKPLSFLPTSSFNCAAWKPFHLPLRMIPWNCTIFLLHSLTCPTIQPFIGKASFASKWHSVIMCYSDATLNMNCTLWTSLAHTCRAE